MLLNLVTLVCLPALEEVTYNRRKVDMATGLCQPTLYHSISCHLERSSCHCSRMMTTEAIALVVGCPHFGNPIDIPLVS
jgi:hypothetical protein